MTTPVVLKLYGLDSSEERKELSSWVGVFFLGEKLSGCSSPGMLGKASEHQLSDPA